MNFPIEVHVVCVNPENGQQMAYSGHSRAFAFTQSEAVMRLLIAIGAIKLEIIEATE